MCSSLTEGEEGFSLPHNLKDSVVYVGESDLLHGGREVQEAGKDRVMTP